MGKRRIMHFGDVYEIQEFDGDEWVTVGELPTLERAKQLLKDLKKIDTV